MTDSEDTIPEYDRELRLKLILDRYALGDSPRAIAYDLRIPFDKVFNTIKKAAQNLRDQNRERVEEAYLQQDLGLSHLIARCMQAIERAAQCKPPALDKEAVKCLIMVYDRLSKLHGLDKGATKPAAGLYSWLETASKDKLIEKAKAMGLSLPVAFATPEA